MLALLGALLVKLDRAAEAERTLLQAIAHAPTFAKPHEDLGYLLVQQDRAAEALPYLERATHLDPKLEKAWFTLGKALAMLGRGADADKAFERCFELSPERRMMALAAEHQKEGRLEEAEHLYRRILRHDLQKCRRDAPACPDRGRGGDDTMKPRACCKGRLCSPRIS